MPRLSKDMVDGSLAYATVSVVLSPPGSEVPGAEVVERRKTWLCYIGIVHLPILFSVRQ